MMHLDPRDLNDLFWHYNLADAEIGHIPSTFPKPQFHLPVKNVRELRCGPIEVTISHEHATYEMDLRVLHLVSRWRRIKRALDVAGPATAKVLELRFRVPLAVDRWAFDTDGRAMMKRLTNRAPGALQAELSSIRGAGSVAHLTAAAAAEHRRSRSTRTLERWLDVQGRCLVNGKSARPRDWSFADSVRREAEDLVAQAVRIYRGEWLRAKDLDHSERLAA